MPYDAAEPGIHEGFELLDKMRLRGACPDPLLALIHCKGEESGGDRRPVGVVALPDAT